MYLEVVIVEFTPPLPCGYSTPIYFAAQNTGEVGEMYFPFASASILYVTPRNATEHGIGGRRFNLVTTVAGIF